MIVRLERLKGMHKRQRHYGVSGLMALVLLALLAACGGAGGAGAPQAPTCENIVLGDATAGEELFHHTLRVTGGRAPKCIACHAVDDAEMENVGPGLLGIASTAANRVPDQTAEQYLCESILYPREYIVEGYPEDIILMPVTYSTVLTQQQVNDLVAYMMTLE
jgi:mono/diheme cytochrome c family protein